MFSGGLDSTYLSWKFMVENNYKLHLHHISLRNDTAFPWKTQDRSAREIVSYFKNQGFDFGYSESVFEFFGWGRVGLDVDVEILFAQKVARNLRTGRVKVCTGGYWDNRMDLIAKKKRMGRIQNIWKYLIETEYPEHCIDKKLSFPLLERGIDKKQMIEEMPKELFKLTWSCRKPIDGKACKGCKPCADIAEATK